jgi:hypothetical protein
MKKKKFSEAKIVEILQAGKSAVVVSDLSRPPLLAKIDSKIQ